MALDFAVLGGDGKPRRQVSIRADAHQRLMQFARIAGSPLLERIAEYYEDAEIAFEEIPGFVREIEALLDRSIDDQEVVSFLRSLKELALLASAAKVPIAVIAD